MKVFISWSGNRSKALANALRDWLPMVLQYVEPWVSDKDISAGERWAQTIAGELAASNFGIICITPENMNSAWIQFEAGALSKSMLDGKVIPLLFGLELSELSGPLSQFQAQKTEESGLKEVVKAINKVAEEKAKEEVVDKLVPSLWPQFQTLLDDIPDTEAQKKHQRPHDEILEELVTSVRNLSTRMRDIEPMSAPSLNLVNKKRSRFDPRMFRELFISTLSIQETPSISLLVIAGLIREQIPWLAEILTEGYREIRDGGSKETKIAIHRLRRTIKPLLHNPMLHEMALDSADLMFIMEELPFFLDEILNNIDISKDHYFERNEENQIRKGFE